MPTCETDELPVIESGGGRRSSTRSGLVAAVAVALLSTVVACGPPAGETDEAGPPGTVEVYSGRSEAVMAPLLDLFTERTGVATSARHGVGSELTSELLGKEAEEGDGEVARVFVSDGMVSLGRLAAQGRLARIPPDILMRVPERFRGEGGDWIGLSARGRVLVYDTRVMERESLPRGLDELGSVRFAGRFGLAPRDPSFLAQLSAYHAIHGEEALRRFLEELAANRPRVFDDEVTLVDAVIAGDIDFGLADHTRLWRAASRQPDIAARNSYMSEGGVSTFLEIAGAGMLRDAPASRRLLEFLISEDAQRLLAQETYEYPLTAGVSPAAQLVPLSELDPPEVASSTLAGAAGDVERLLEEIGLQTGGRP